MSTNTKLDVFGLPNELLFNIASGKVQSVSICEWGCGPKALQSLFNTITRSNKVLSLTISCNTVNPEVAESLAYMINQQKSLASLDLTDCQLNDRCVKALSQAFYNKHCLDDLMMQFNNITAKGIGYFCRSIEESLRESCLRLIDVSYNPIGDAGVKRLTQFLQNISSRTNLTLQHLYMNSVGATDECIPGLVPVLKQLVDMPLAVYLKGNTFSEAKQNELLCFTNCTLKVHYMGKIIKHEQIK